MLVLVSMSTPSALSTPVKYCLGEGVVERVLEC